MGYRVSYAGPDHLTIEAHRGRLTLNDGPTCGLVARIDLPTEAAVIATR